MNKCYTEFPIDIYPLVNQPEFYFKDWPYPRRDMPLDITHLNPELLKYFEEKQVHIGHNFLLWHWKVQEHHVPHTDGDWQLIGADRRKRLSGINWNFTPDTWVEFFSFDGMTPKLIHKNKDDFSTHWEGTPTQIDKWEGAGPVIFNPQMLHRVAAKKNVWRRVSMTLKFHESYEELVEKLMGVS